MTVIEAADLRRTYRTRVSPWKRATREVEAVRGVSFTVERGELFGLLGPNGAGKTTTIKMLITLLLPTSGTARVLGRDVVAEPREVRRRVGYVFGGDRGLYERLSGLDNLRYFAELYGVPPREQRARIGELLELTGLAGREKERVEGYSRGMRQRLHIARGLLHRPDVLFLDEPSIGIDPVGARELRTTVADLRNAGTTVLLTTHYMFEADELCDRIAVIAGGRIVAEGTPADLKSRVGEGTVSSIRNTVLSWATARALQKSRNVCSKVCSPSRKMMSNFGPGGAARKNWSEVVSWNLILSVTRPRHSKRNFGSTATLFAISMAKKVFPRATPISR